MPSIKSFCYITLSALMEATGMSLYVLLVVPRVPSAMCLVIMNGVFSGPGLTRCFTSWSIDKRSPTGAPLGCNLTILLWGAFFVCARMRAVWRALWHVCERAHSCCRVVHLVQDCSRTNVALQYWSFGYRALKCSVCVVFSGLHLSVPAPVLSQRLTTTPRGGRAPN